MFFFHSQSQRVENEKSVVYARRRSCGDDNGKSNVLVRCIQAGFIFTPGDIDDVTDYVIHRLCSTAVVRDNDDNKIIRYFAALVMRTGWLIIDILSFFFI